MITNISKWAIVHFHKSIGISLAYLSQSPKQTDTQNTQILMAFILECTHCVANADNPQITNDRKISSYWL